MTRLNPTRHPSPSPSAAALSATPSTASQAAFALPGTSRRAKRKDAVAPWSNLPMPSADWASPPAWVLALLLASWATGRARPGRHRPCALPTRRGSHLAQKGSRDGSHKAELSQREWACACDLDGDAARIEPV
ncbi:hypothetical protein VFPBJ_08446 [Purpureocillium lilacinum]|uniref:Uncharacterized protein n=1 Tax=Purpureocillium lilacinum TaxID=33203 RepID=A0A179GE30_PURLI|nr:hypothetical protein VFPBJ_08446 [Purpureocillium lilacinum]